MNVAFEDALSDVLIVNWSVNVWLTLFAPVLLLPPTAIEKLGVIDAFSVVVTEENALSVGLFVALAIEPSKEND